MSCYVKWFVVVVRVGTAREKGSLEKRCCRRNGGRFHIAEAVTTDQPHSLSSRPFLEMFIGILGTTETSLLAISAGVWSCDLSAVRWSCS